MKCPKDSVCVGNGGVCGTRQRHCQGCWKHDVYLGFNVDVQ